MALRAPCGLKSGSDLTLLQMSDAWRQGFGSQCSTSISMMTETAGHYKSSDTDGWHSGGSSLPFSVSDFAIKKNKPNRASVSADCPGLPPVPGVGGVLRPDAPSPAGPQGCREAGKHSRGGDSA